MAYSPIEKQRVLAADLNGRDLGLRHRGGGAVPQMGQGLLDGYNFGVNPQDLGGLFQQFQSQAPETPDFGLGGGK